MGGRVQGGHRDEAEVHTAIVATDAASAYGDAGSLWWRK